MTQNIYLNNNYEEEKTERIKYLCYNQQFFLSKYATNA